MGLDIYLYTKQENSAGKHEDVPSVKHPKNINNRRYLRSSYNGGGFNNAVPRLTGNDNFTYYEVFEPLGNLDEYQIELNDVDKLLKCRGRAQDIVEALKVTDGITVTTVSAGAFSGDHTDQEALKVFREKYAEYQATPGPFGAFSSGQGHFWLDEPLQILAAIPGKDILGHSAMHLIYKSEGAKDHYLASAEVLVEFIEEAIQLVTNDGVAYMHWSG